MTLILSTKRSKNNERKVYGEFTVPKFLSRKCSLTSTAIDTVIKDS